LSRGEKRSAESRPNRLQSSFEARGLHPRQNRVGPRERWLILALLLFAMIGSLALSRVSPKAAMVGEEFLLFRTGLLWPLNGAGPLPLVLPQ